MWVNFRLPRTLYILLLLGFIFLLFAGASLIQVEREGPTAAGRALIPVLSPRMIYILVGLFLVAGILALVLGFCVMRRLNLTKEELDRIRRMRWFMTLAFLTPAVLFLFLLYRNWEEGEEGARAGGRVGGALSGLRGLLETDLIREAERAPELGYLIFVPVALLLLGIICFSGYLIYRRDTFFGSGDGGFLIQGLEQEEEEGLRREMAEAIGVTMEDLVRERDLRSAVILCYARLEEILSDYGVRRLPHRTPREFVHTVLRRLSVPRKRLRSLNELYERARFSQHTIKVRDRDRAVGDFQEIRSALLRLEGEGDAD